jgi:hypothetical protein
LPPPNSEPSLCHFFVFMLGSRNIVVRLGRRIPRAMPEATLLALDNVWLRIFLLLSNPLMLTSQTTIARTTTLNGSGGKAAAI